MILGSRVPYKVGERYVSTINIGDGTWTGSKYYHDQPFVVLRPATAEEWVQDCIADCGPPPADPIGLALANGFKYFYAISTD